jgi:hypothetical protein
MVKVRSYPSSSGTTLAALGVVALLVLCFSATVPRSGGVVSPGALGVLEAAASPPTPPPSFDCESYGSSILVIAPSPASGPVGTVVTLEGSGYYNQATKGSFTIWIANYTGGSLIYLTSIAAPAPEPFWVNVTVPSTDGGVPLVPGPYEFWSLNDSKLNPGCANYPFTVTGTSPPTSPTSPTAPSSGSGFSTTDIELLVLVAILAVVVLIVVVARRRKEERDGSAKPSAPPPKETPKRPP